jgi:subtilisin family serine protease
MPGKSRNVHPILGLVLLGLVLTTLPLSLSTPAAAQDSILDLRGGDRSGTDRGSRTLGRDHSDRAMKRDTKDHATDRYHGGGHGGVRGGFGAGLGIGIGGAVLEQLMAPPPASNTAEGSKSTSKKNATRNESHAASKASRVDARNTTDKGEPHLSQQPVGGGNNGQSGVPPRGERRFVADEVITEFRPNATQQAIDQIARQYSLTLLESQNFELIGNRLFRWRIGGRSSLRDVIGRLEDERVVASAQPNYIFNLQEDAGAISTDKLGDASQYVLGKLQIGEAHQVATGKNILVAVIDSEIDLKHPDLNATIAKSFDGLGSEQSPHKHGTAMAGAIASHGKLLGIAPGVQLLAARVFDNTPEQAKGASFTIYKGLQWAADNGARVVNMSFSGPADPDLHRFLAAVFKNGLVLIAAAGNAGPDSGPSYPASDPDVIAVTATDNNDSVFKMASRGQYIAVAAPGVEIIALAPGESYQLTTGTSVAAAHVSGIAALMLEHQPTLKPADIRSILMTTAKPLATGKRSDFGAGLVNAYRAVAQPDGKSAGADDGNAEAKK